MMTTEYLKTVRRFVKAELSGDARQLDELAEKPSEVYEKFRETGLANWWLPEELGGRGLGLEDGVEIVNEIAYGDAGVAFTLFISVLGTTMVQLYGSDDLKARYLRPMAERGSFCATLGSERTAGSELNKIETVATREGGDLVISGEKFFSTNTDFADFLVVIARSAEDPEDYLAVVVPRTPRGRDRQALGRHRAAGLPHLPGEAGPGPGARGQPAGGIRSPAARDRPQRQPHPDRGDGARHRPPGP
ncbi:acyl-CoA dehydrogenase family protein [Kitasatospora aburaviensis]